MTTPAFVADLIEELSEDDRRRLAESLEMGDVAADRLAAALVPHARAALEEYVLQYAGRQVPRRIGDLEQLRLLLLTKSCFDGVLPSPDIVAQLFQKNATEAKTLIRNTATRYRHELKPDMDQRAWEVVTTTAVGETVIADNAERRQWTIEVRDAALLEHIKDSIRRGPGVPSGLSTSPARQMHTYVLDNSTAEALADRLGRTMEDFLAAVEAS